MEKDRALANIVFVAVVLALALSLVFGPLLEFERLMKNEREWWIWLGEWVGADLLLTFFLCRQEVRALLGRRPE